MTGYEINMRQDKRTGEYQAYIPGAYRNRHGDRYYLAYTLEDGWVELSPEYATKSTKPVSAYPERLMDCVNQDMGYLLTPVNRLRG